VHWALSLGEMPRSKTADALGTVRNLLNYSNPVPFLKIAAADFSRLLFLAHILFAHSLFLLILTTKDGRWPRRS
jgi:hypothetical protein